MVLERNAVDGQGFKAGDVLFRHRRPFGGLGDGRCAEGDIGALKAGPERSR